MSRKRRTRAVEVVEREQDPIDKANQQLYNDIRTKALRGKFDEHQQAYYRGTKEKRISIVDDGAGKGKTTVAFVSGIEELRRPKFSKLMYIRFVDDRAQSLGFLPGDKNEKEFVYFKPAYQALAKCGIQREAVDLLIQSEQIEFTTNIHMRGTDYENVFVIIDEAQNARDIEDLKLVLTRFHDNCTIVLIGHSKQTDSKIRKIKGRTPFQLYQIHLLKKKWTQRFSLEVDYRGELCRYADSIEDTIAELEDEKAG